MINRHVRGAVTWVDLEAPTSEELSAVMTEFGIDNRIEEEIASPTPYPLTLATPDYHYLILHFPAAEATEGTKNQEVDFIVGRDFVITARYEVIDSILALHKLFEAEELVSTPTATHADVLLEQVMTRLYGAIHDEIERAGRALDRIEHDIFSGKERQTVRTISQAGRALLRFETALARHEEPLDEFLAGLSSGDFFSKRFTVRAARIRAAHDHATALVASYRAVTRELRITNDSLLSSSQNEVMKTLTLIAVAAMPMTLVASVFGMNVTHIPFANEPAGFWLIIGIMVIAALVLYIFFRIKRWF
ncbi:MAG: magnesium transporter CorA family protein [Patescibacteria group bacterium]